MFTSLPIEAGTDKYLQLLQSHLTWEWMLIVLFPTEEKSQKWILFESVKAA